jgi:hypothetical protein
VNELAAHHGERNGRLRKLVRRRGERIDLHDGEVGPVTHRHLTRTSLLADGPGGPGPVAVQGHCCGQVRGWPRTTTG